MMGILRILFSVLLFFPLVGNAFTPTSAQIEAFKNLSPAQQQALAKQYGVSMPSSLDRAPIKPVSTPELVKPRAVQASSAGDAIQENANVKPEIREKKVSESVKKELKQYGYDLFAGSPTTFAPATDVPVSSDYVVGPGDTLIVQLYGKENATHELVVNREGVISFPQLGPLTVSGMMFSEMKGYIKDTVDQQMIGVKATVTMGGLRSIRIFVLGEAYRPGSYTVSSLSTITNALFSSGGITNVGSLRHIQLKREGKLIGELDLYDLLLRGDTSQDQRLLPGDVIFIPPIGQTVGVAGEVKRPAIYELKSPSSENTVEDLVQLAGGFLPTAYRAASRIERIGTRGVRTIVDVDLTISRDRKTKVRDADVIQIFSVLDTVEDSVLLKGHVKRPGGFAWKKGLRVTDLVPSVHSLLPRPDLSYALIKREKQPSRDIELIKVSLGEAIRRPSSAANIELKSRDTLWVFDSSAARLATISEINEQVKFQTQKGVYADTVKVLGNVYIPGEYPIHNDMTLGELLDAARSFKPETDLSKALLVHKDPDTGKSSVELISLVGSALGQPVKPKDELIVFHLEEERSKSIEHVISQLQHQADKNEELKIVSVSGYVKAPGTYPLVPRMTVNDLILLAGGFDEQAFGLEAEITRIETDEKQHQIFERLALDLTEKKGGLTAELASRDQLYIKRIPNWNEKETASISGEVNFPGVYPIYKGDTISDLVERAGGITEYAEPGAAIFLRESLRKREAEQLRRFKQQLERDLAELKVEAAQNVTGTKETKALGGALLTQLVETKPMGRLVIDLPRILGGKDRSDRLVDVELKGLDQLIIPPKNPEVSVLGEIQFPTSHLYIEGSDVFDYIDISGGFSSRADKGRVYVIKSNGKVAAVKNGWFIKRNTEISPGDTVVVPYDVYSASPLAYWGSVSQILFQLATTVAALNTIGVF